MDKDVKINLGVAAAIGAAIWALSPYVTGAIEPWDAESPYYIISIFIAGLVLGLYKSKQIWAFAVGIFVGQLLYMLIFLPLGPLIIIGCLFLVGSSLICYLGSSIAKAVK